MTEQIPFIFEPCYEKTSFLHMRKTKRQISCAVIITVTSVLDLKVGWYNVLCISLAFKQSIELCFLTFKIVLKMLGFIVQWMPGLSIY